MTSSVTRPDLASEPWSDDHPVAPGPALAELFAGNERFVSGTQIHPNQGARHRAAVALEQAPFAVILGCSDSRLAAEIIFDQGLGDLFVVRTAGHTVGPEVLGSIEYAVTVLNTPLVVVLGHDSCGAVQAARDAVASDVLPAGHLGALVESVVPSVRIAGAHGVDDPDRIVELHIERTVDLLLERSGPLGEAVSAGRCAVVGMSYQLRAGRVRMVADAGLAPDATGPTPVHSGDGPVEEPVLQQ